MGNAALPGNARAYPQVGTHLEGRVAAIAEIDSTSAAWLQEHTATLARESGLPAREIRAVYPPDFKGAAVDDARQAEAMLQLHRWLVRVDPRVDHAGGDMLSWTRVEDMRRFQELTEQLNSATRSSNQATENRLNQEIAALNRWID